MDRLSKVTSRLSNPWLFRQSSVPVPGDGSQSSGKQNNFFKTFSASSTNLPAVGAEHKTENGAESIDASLTTRPPTFNVVLFGETGVGKSSVINLIARKSVAQVSSDVNGCTMQSTRYDIPFDDMNFAIFDTIGLEEPQMGVNGYLKAIEKAYELIMKLSAAGGIHLLLFCMRGGRITATTQSNYRLFHECLCHTKVPIALVFTGLEREAEMENWWERNERYIKGYGIESKGHACITAVRDDTPGEDLKFTESQTKIRKLLRDCSLKNEAFSPDSHTWFARLGRGLKSFIAKHKSPKKRDVVKVLTQRCKLDPETAKKIAEMMEKGDSEANDTREDAQPGSGANGDGSSSLKAIENGGSEGARNPASDQLGNVASRHARGQPIDDEPNARPPGGTMRHDGSRQGYPNNVDVAPGEDKVVLTSLAEDHPLPNQPVAADPGPPVIEKEDTEVGLPFDGSHRADDAMNAKPWIAQTNHDDGATTVLDGGDDENESITEENASPQPLRDGEAGPPANETGRRDENETWRENIQNILPSTSGMEVTSAKRPGRNGDPTRTTGMPSQTTPRTDTKWRASSARQSSLTSGPHS